MTPPSTQRFDLEDTGKLVVIVAASEMTREYLSNRKSCLNTSMSKMASFAMLIGGALANALSFTSTSYLFSRLSRDGIDKEREAKLGDRAAAKGAGRMGSAMARKD